MDNPWNKDRKEPSLDKETDKNRIARLEKEVQELKNNQNKNTSFDDDRIFKRKPSNNENESLIEKDKIVKKSGIGCMTWIVIIIAFIYVLGNLGDDDKPKTKSYSSSPTTNSTKSSLSWSGEPSSSTKAKIIMSIENNQMVSKAAFGNDVVGGDSAYEIFWIWMPEIKGKDYDSIAEFFCPVFKQNGLSGIVVSIKRNNSYDTLGRGYCR